MKYEEVYLNAYENPDNARQSLGKYFERYNSKRRHQSLDGRTPNTVYFQQAAMKAA
ncbi:MAG: integrase core domain-containing protein [Methylococcales bacterium]|nr:integrase core domain-containing protein [Methylococcales bacterium]